VFGPRIASFTDGTSNTWLVAEAEQPVPWTKPDDLPFDPNGPLPRLGTRAGGYTAAFADGWVRQFRLDTPEATLRAYITRDGNEVVPPDPDNPAAAAPAPDQAAPPVRPRNQFVPPVRPVPPVPPPVRPPRLRR
jgi:hypothetical protein